MSEIFDKVKDICLKAKKASSQMAVSSGATRDSALSAFAEELRKNADIIISANAEDLSAADKNGVKSTMLDRLRVDKSRIEAIAEAVEALVMLGDPIGGGEVTKRPNGLEIKKIKVPLGVVGVIFEARPNVSADIAALCLKSGNSAVLRGGREALKTNIAIVNAAHAALEKSGLPTDAVSLIDFTDREGADALMQMRGIVDVLIPRGGKGLIKAVAENSKVPVIETGAGNCHLYVHGDADIEMALKIAVNAKTSRPSVCNAVETILVHEGAAKAFLPRLKKEFDALSTEIRGSAEVREIIEAKAATEEDYATEYNDYIAAVKVVSSLDEAVEHINRYSTAHSEAIVTESRSAAEYFTQHIDSACVYVNASTRFTDGGEFGLGAEVGISTQKLHARGPMGLSALTTDKYIINGNGQIR